MSLKHHPIAVVAHDEAWRGAMAAVLHAGGYATVTTVSRVSDAGTGTALAIVAGGSADLGEALIQGPPEVPVLAVGPDNSAVMVRAMENGAVGYVIEDVPFDQIVQAVSQSLDGHAVIPSHMLGALLRRVVARQRLARADQERLELLTGREREVLEMAAQGLSNDELAGRLYISPATARTHLERVFKKLNVHTRAEVVAFAARCGLATEGSME